MLKGKLYSEILEEFQKAETKQDRLSVLKKYDNIRFRQFLVYALDQKIEFDVEIPNYRPAPEPAGLNFSYLDLEVPKLYRFIKNHPKRPEGLTSHKQKQLLSVILESLFKDEAEILVSILQRKFKVPNLTIKLIQEAYPGM